MADISSTVKKTVKKGVEAVSNVANSLAASARFKVTELNLVNERREILVSFGQKAYELWKNGAAFPPEMEVLLQEVSSLEAQLEAVRAERQLAAERELLAMNEAAAMDAQLLEKKGEAQQTDDDLDTLPMPEIREEPENAGMPAEEPADSQTQYDDKANG